ncbi:hypothetical protein GCM10009557_77540 [Virgisporangium ochraceum]|uniref:Uncharacterized protein n=1 Tax=Virgisporangium ochraceum TaxID=65505 RepID=A0A8J3ZRT5_9ACTN|nr:hypothetical protein [Virgisporangium ochraceum]GIJ67155.1 hypothetical protein Voc01_020720 [Virgisporangium ochraceum]
MMSRAAVTGLFRNRFAWAAVILMATVGAVALVNTAGSDAEPTRAGDVRSQILGRMRTTLEKADPGQHNHGGHNPLQGDGQAKPPVICGVHVYGFEPEGATALADVKTVYGFHLCGVAEPKRPWDVAVKLAGPVILDMSTDPPGIQVVEATADVMYIDRLRQMFPAKYSELAQKEALAPSEMSDLRRRYDDAADL